MKKAETYPRSDLKYFSSMNYRVTSGDVDLSEEMIDKYSCQYTVYISTYILKFDRYNLPHFPGLPSEM